MPAVSEKQRRLFAIAEHHPEELKSKNKGILKMSHQQLHDFAATPGLGGSTPGPPKPKQTLTPRYPGALNLAKKKANGNSYF